MNWRLLSLLSIVGGAAIGFITLLHFHAVIEQLFWLIDYLICGYFIFRYSNEKYFQHGVLSGILQCITVLVIHLLFYNIFIAHHLDIAKVNSKLENGLSPYLALTIIELTKGIFSSLFFGIFAYIMGKGLKKVFRL